MTTTPKKPTCPKEATLRYILDHARAGLESGGNVYLQLNLINAAAKAALSLNPAPRAKSTP
jgi:hypothetical protein